MKLFGVLPEELVNDVIYNHWKVQSKGATKFGLRRVPRTIVHGIVIRRWARRQTARVNVYQPFCVN